MLLTDIFYIFDAIKSWKYIDFIKYSFSYNLFQYYFSINCSNRSGLVTYKNDSTAQPNNMVIFSRPKKQLFLMFFKTRPIFIFTGGLMRIVMNEKKKSSKKIYKVATSLIKLFTILLCKRHFFPSGVVKLINVGNLRSKILKNLYKVTKYSKIQYVIIKFRTDFTSQKLETRRAIKKYIKNVLKFGSIPHCVYLRDYTLL